MEIAVTTRSLPSVSHSRVFISKPVHATTLRFRPKQGLVYSGPDWSSVTDFVVAKKFVDEKSVETNEDEKEEEKDETVYEAEVKEESIWNDESEEQNLASNLLKELSVTLESEDKSKLLIYGGGAFLALWISSIVVSAIDSIPLFPKLMEVVGLGYTVWFTSRYLLFKENRDELFTNIVNLKDQVLGSDAE